MLLLTPNEINVAGGSYLFPRHVVVRLALQAIDSRQEAAYAVVTLGSLAAHQDPVKMCTVVFELSQIQEHAAARKGWPDFLKKNPETSMRYPGFLLTFLKERGRLELAFLVKGNRVDLFQVSLGCVSAPGRMPSGLNLLTSHLVPTREVSEA